MTKHRTKPQASIIRTVVVILLAAVATGVAAQDTKSLNDAVVRLGRDKDMLHASLSVSVRDVDHGNAVYSYDADRSLTPGSLVKLFTTAAGFDMLGSDFRFTTTIAYNGNIDGKGVLHGNVYIIGGGDPLLGSYRYRQTQPDSVFAAWHKALNAIGIRGISGKICYNASIFDQQQLPDSWSWGDIGNYYGTGATGLNFHENLFFINFNAGSKPGYPASIASTTPPSLDVNLQSNVMTGAANSGDQVIVYGEPNSTVRVCWGTVPQGKQGFGVRASMPRPARTCAELFAAYLRRHGVTVSQAVEEVYAKPGDMKEVLRYMSNAYYAVAQYTNLTSNNTYAESIYKYLGYQRYGVGSYANGAKATAAFFSQLGLTADGVHLADGSGLSRENLCTADFVTRFLASVGKKEIYNDFLQTLGEPGKSGTVHSLKLNMPQGVSMHVKSGTMTKVRCFAGYVTTASGKTYSYAILCNAYDCSDAAAKEKLATLLEEISKI